jgi:hypothetical protein
MWDLWWTKWRWGRFFPSNSVSPANLQSTSFSTITITYHPGLVQYASSGRSTQSPTALIKNNVRPVCPIYLRGHCTMQLVCSTQVIFIFLSGTSFYSQMVFNIILSSIRYSHIGFGDHSSFGSKVCKGGAFIFFLRFWGFLFLVHGLLWVIVFS